MTSAAFAFLMYIHSVARNEAARGVCKKIAGTVYRVGPVLNSFAFKLAIETVGHMIHCRRHRKEVRGQH